MKISDFLKHKGFKEENGKLVYVIDLNIDYVNELNPYVKKDLPDYLLFESIRLKNMSEEFKKEFGEWKEVLINTNAKSD